MRPDEPVALSAAMQLGKRGNPTGANQYTPEEDRKSRDTRIPTLGSSDNKAYVLARLDRDRPDLAERVRARELSANAAAVEAGGRKRTIVVPDDMDAAAALV